MGDVIGVFARWWNSLASNNGKLKFKTQQEAADFVRRVQIENGGPNAKIIEMRRRYNEARAGTPGPLEGGNKAVLR
jgi:hypothetical protein